MFSSDVIASLIEAAFGIVFGALATEAWSQLRILKIRESYESPVKIPKGDRRNLVLLVGLGGTGKTSLIRTLFREKGANYKKKTEYFEKYSHDYPISVKASSNRSSSRTAISRAARKSTRPSKHWLYISDYKGQNIAQLVRQFILEQRNPNSTLAFGYINSLIIVVDLFPPKSAEDSPELEKQDHPDDNRIKANIDQWNDTALSMLSGLVTEDLSSVILFINKVDLLNYRSTEVESKCKFLYDELRRRIQKIFHGIDCHVILGSASKGTNVAGVDDDSLMFYLLSNSVSSNS